MMKDVNANRPGYKETKVGWIPEGWGVEQVGDIAEIAYGLTVNQERRKSTRKMPYLTVANFGTDNFKLDRIKEIGCLEGDEKRYKLEYHDILMVEGNGSRNIVGMGRLWLGCNRSILHQNHLLRVRVDCKVAIPMFVVALIRAEGFRHRLQSKIITSSGLHTINSKVVVMSFLPLPPLPEQKKIAEILSVCDEVIEKTAELIEAKKRQKKALMQQLLSGKKRLPGFEGEWESVRVSCILKHVFRPVDWAPDRIFNLISIRRRSGGIFRRDPLRGDEYKTKDLHEVRGGDFLISKRQVSHGALAMVRDEFHGCHVSKEYTILENKNSERLHMPYFDWLSRTEQMWWLAYVASNGVVIEKLIFATKDFLKFEIKLPPTPEEQERIIEVLEACDRELILHRNQLEAIREQKRGLMQKLLTGQIRVKI